MTIGYGRMEPFSFSIRKSTPQKLLIQKKVQPRLRLASYRNERQNSTAIFYCKPWYLPLTATSKTEASYNRQSKSDRYAHRCIFAMSRYRFCRGKKSNKKCVMKRTRNSFFLVILAITLSAYWDEEGARWEGDAVEAKVKYAKKTYIKIFHCNISLAVFSWSQH